MRLTLIHPCIGRIPNKDYIRSWQMEPLPMAYLAGMTPKDIDIKFYDDRMEKIPYDEETDLVAMSIETYTAKRSYQIASEYRRRGIPVVMGGFHATLVPDEVMEYADAIVVGEAEGLWPKLIEDFQNGELKKKYSHEERPKLNGITPDRRIFKGKRYLDLGLVEVGRGCTFRCDFCAIQTAFNATQNHRNIEHVIQEIKSMGKRKLFFFVDDNFVAKPKYTKAFLKALIPLKIKWVSQGTITMVHDEELLDLMIESGCQGILIGFESLNPNNLKLMNKQFNRVEGGVSSAIKKLHRKGLRLYATFVFGYEHDQEDDIAETVKFCKEHDIFMVAFNHLTPFPGTPLYKKLEREGKLLYDKWWLDERYKYGQVPFESALSPDFIQHACVDARKSFYTYGSIIKRAFNRVKTKTINMTTAYFFINYLLHKEASQRENYPLGDQSENMELLKVKQLQAKEVVRA